MKKKTKKEYYDDGHTIYNMDVDGFKWHDKKKKEASSNVDEKDRWALIKSAYKAFLPKLLIIILAFTLAIVLIYFWLK